MRLPLIFLMILWGGWHAPLKAAPENLRTRLASLGKLCQQQGETLQTLEQEIAALDSARLQKTSELRRKHQNITELLSLLHRLDRHGPGFIFSGNQPPEETIRSMIVLQALLRNVSETKFSLQQEMQEIAKIRGDMDAKKQALALNLESYKKRYNEVEKLLKQRRSMVDQELGRRHTLEAKVATLSHNVESLEELINRLENDPKVKSGKGTGQQVPISDLLKCRPIIGKIVAKFGEPHALSPSGKGLVFETTRHSHVVAPFDSQVVFAGPFRSYKDILILAHGNEYHALMIGMERIDVSVGQTVLAGEPIGRMKQDAAPQLYLELRHKGLPINPLT